MTTAELARRLSEEGCNPATYAINQRSYDGFCLVFDGLQWAVFYSERSQDQAPFFTSADELAACEFYLDFMVNHMQHQHCVGFLRSEKAAQTPQAKLASRGIKTHADRIPYRQDDYRHRVFVMGKDIFTARQLLGEALPLTDVEDAHPRFWKWLRQRWPWSLAG